MRPAAGFITRDPAWHVTQTHRDCSLECTSSLTSRPSQPIHQLLLQNHLNCLLYYSLLSSLADKFSMYMMGFFWGGNSHYNAEYDEFPLVNTSLLFKVYYIRKNITVSLSATHSRIALIYIDSRLVQLFNFHSTLFKLYGMYISRKKFLRNWLP